MSLFNPAEIHTEPTLKAQKAMAETSLDAAFSVALYYQAKKDLVEATRYAVLAAAQFPGHPQQNALQSYLENEFFTPFNTRIPLGKIITQGTDNPSLALIPSALSGTQRLNNTDAKAIALALAHNLSLHTLELPNNDITADGAVALAGALKTNTSLKTLGLAFNKIEDQGIEAFASLLEVNASLTTLRFRTTSCTDQGAMVLAQALKKNNTLQTLEFSCDKITGKGLQALREALKENLSLQTLVMKGVMMPLEHQQQFEALTARNRCFAKVKALMPRLQRVEALESPGETVKELISLKNDHEAIKDKVGLPSVYRMLFQRLESMISLFEGLELLNKAGVTRTPGALKPQQTHVLLALAERAHEKFKRALTLDSTNTFANKATLDLVVALHALQPAKDGPKDHLARLNFCSVMLEQLSPNPKDEAFCEQLTDSIQSSKESLEQVIAAGDQGVGRTLRMSAGSQDSFANLDELYDRSPESSPSLIKKPEKPK